MDEKRPLVQTQDNGLPQAPETKQQLYNKVLQGKGINGLIASSGKHGGMQIDAITHTGTMKSDGVLITIDEESIENMTPQTFKVLILILTVATEQLPRANAITAEAINKGRKIQIPLSQYMKSCKLRNVKEAHKQLSNAINALYGVSFDWTDTVYEKPEGKSRKVKIQKPYRMRLLGRISGSEEIDGKPIKKGVAEVNIDFDMAEYLSGAYIMPYPDTLLSINTHYHPYSIPLGWKLCALQNMNFGTSRANTTTVKTLLNSAKGIPRYSDLALVGKIYERIISPFDRDIAALVEAGVLSSYWYFDSNGNKIDGSQLGGLSYSEFSALNVHYELNNYPDQTPRLEAKNKRIKAAINRNKNASKKKNETKDGTQ